MNLDEDGWPCEGYKRIAPEPAHAQPASATIAWQVSQDYVNWSFSTSIDDPAMNHVQVRALLTYQAPTTHLTRFGLSMADPTIVGRNGAGASDTVEEIYHRENVALLHGFQDYQATRVGGILKIDAPGDTSPPGQGPGWVTSYQSTPFFQPLTDDLPVIVLYQYTLVLDGTSGVRDINGAFRQLSGDVPNSFVGIWAPGTTINSWTNYPIPTEVVPATVRVNVPSPSPLAILLLATAPLATRRRRA